MVKNIYIHIYLLIKFSIGTNPIYGLMCLCVCKK